MLFYLLERVVLKGTWALHASAWILHSDAVMLIHFENCQIHDETTHDIALSSENTPFWF